MNKNHNDFQIANATLNNILKDFCKKGHIRQLYINKPYYDIDTEPHMHFYNKAKNELVDVCDKKYLNYILENINVPEGKKIDSLSFVINLDKEYY